MNKTFLNILYAMLILIAPLILLIGLFIIPVYYFSLNNKVLYSVIFLVLIVIILALILLRKVITFHKRSGSLRKTLCFVFKNIYFMALILCYLLFILLAVRFFIVLSFFYGMGIILIGSAVCFLLTKIYISLNRKCKLHNSNGDKND